MENQIQPDVQSNIPPVEPIAQPSVSPSTNWSKILLSTLLGLIVVAGLVFASYQIGKKQNIKPQPSIIQPTAIPTLLPAEPKTTAAWKTYTNTFNKYQLSYPSSWYVYEYGEPNNSIDISDLPNPTNMHSLDPKGHTLIQVGWSSGSMPTNILYTNGPDKINPTVKNFSVNSYTGIRGQQDSTFGVVGETVYLNDPRGGYYFFIKELDPEQLFDQILSTFKFLDQPTTKLTSIPEDTKLKTYNSTAMGFTFQYPAEYNLPEENGTYLSIISPLNRDRPLKVTSLLYGELKIEIVAQTAVENDSTDKCIHENLGDGKITGQANIVVDGIKTIIYDWEGHGTGQAICFIRNGKRYSIAKYPLATSRQSEFNQILSTFKFL